MLPSAFAQTTTFTYQGYLTDQGAPANGAYDLEFRVFDAATSGTQQGSLVTASDLGVTNGLFTVTVDPGPDVFTGAARWLNIAVRPGASAGAYTNVVPRQLITATPYAVFAGGVNAAGVAGTLPAASLAGTYSGAVIFTNAANRFAGNGGGLTNLNAGNLTGTVPPSALGNAWQTGGNGGTAAGTHFLGTTDNQPVELKVNGGRALRLEPTAGAPNLIGGAANNQIMAPTAGGGVLSGDGHRIFIASDYGVIAGGVSNIIQISSPGGAIGGGQFNRIVNSSTNSVIAGGAFNQVSRDHSVIGGGWQQTNRSSFAFIGGGRLNNIGTDSDYSAIGGGRDNTITNSSQSSIGGGNSNYIAGSFAATIAGGANNNIETSSGLSTISGGQYNSIESLSAYATVAGGIYNDIGASCYYSTIGGGTGNNIGDYNYSATIAGGYFNNIGANSSDSAIGGGTGNAIGANSALATIPGGLSNFATNYAFAAGRKAKANHTGAFVWADSEDADFASQRANQFRVRADGGARFDFNEGEWVDLRYQSNFVTSARIINTSSGGYLSLGGAWVNASDRERKTHFTPVDPQAVLAKVAAMPLSEWSYRTEGESVRHVGPMAQDFHAAFGLGGDDKSIGTVDADGVALAAIQGLNRKLEAGSQKSEDRIQKLETENAEMKRELNEMKQLISLLAGQRNVGAQRESITPQDWHSP